MGLKGLFLSFRIAAVGDWLLRVDMRRMAARKDQVSFRSNMTQIASKKSRIVRWVRLTFCAVGAALAVCFLSFVCIARGGGEAWRTLFRICFWFGWLTALLLFLAKVVGVRMVEQPQDET